MRTLVLGAGATGGYFGGRLLQAGRDVTFLVRPARQSRLRADGLVIKSPRGDAHVHPPTVTANAVGGPYDLVLLSCKAYDLEAAMDAVGPAVGPDTAVLPILNGMRHLDALAARFGDRVLGGLCYLVVTLDQAGAVVHSSEAHRLRFGELKGGDSARVEAVDRLMAGANFDGQRSPAIRQDMWEKWIVLATLAGMTCLMRGPVGDIAAAPGGRELMLGLLDECSATASAWGHVPGEDYLARQREFLTDPGSPVTASMFRDLDKGGRVEADHILGDLLARSEAKGLHAPLLATAYCHLKVYEARRAREGQADA
jgi:2-dehydropantoate 2-reductase